MNCDVNMDKIPSNFVCEFCKKEFARETSMAVHMCEPKRRWQERDERGVQLGLQAYLEFYRHQQGSARLKTFQDFADSAYYRAFVKFGRYCVDTRVINPSQFMSWLLKHNKKIDRWCSDQLYTEYLVEYVQVEAAADALERAMEYALTWAESNSAAPQDCVRYGNVNATCHAIVTGRISPWIIYCSNSGQEFLTNLNSEQVAMIWPYINSDIWQRRLSDYAADREWVTDILTKAGW